MRSAQSYSGVALLLASLMCASSATAATVTLQANLDGLQMVPPNASPAFGLADATLNDVTGAFSITLGSYQDLLGGSFNVFLNDAAVGSNGPLIMTLTNDTPGATTGTFSGGGTLTLAQITDMTAGNTYLRVTSQVFPSGEIRGQLFTVPEPATVVLLGLGALGVLAAARIGQRKRLA